MYQQVTRQVRQVMSRLESVAYVVLRLGDKFPTVSSLQDVDLLTTEPERVKNVIRDDISPPLSLRERTVKPGVQWHLDIYHGHRLLFKFDVYADLKPCYRKVVLHSDCSRQIVASRIVVERSGVKLNVPALATDLALRYMEYIEHPAKVKHLKYVEQLPETDFVRVKPGDRDVTLQK